ncbi:ABC transporter permease [Paenibacillus sp. CGMCC 1.16610]|uniref:ABC transporter permease n=1 Tax=Paenibacillus anseongense TaxID=2682845 RepID=A0ABW9UE83_9BACL|nr:MULTISPECIES: ABC transporter permease [Paenibacillus]MBA2937990.1 ABC transporter permease [Paenibacillus sp. CGMCC 1.16610]MVQ37048.1 ABC transporter permease [Paenibacillus anseongense]
MNSLFIAYNMLRRTILQKRGFLMYLLIPAGVVSLIIGVMGQQQEHRVDIAYINMDRGPLGAHLVQELSGLPDYRLREQVSDADLKEAVTKQSVGGAFVIPEGFSETLLKGSALQVEMYQLSVSEATVTLKITLDSILTGYQGTVDALLEQGLQEKSLQDAVDKTLIQLEKHQVKARVTDLNLYVNPNMHLVIGFMLMFMMGVINNTISVIMEDRRMRTMARTFTAPVRSIEIMLGNFIGSFFVGTLQVLVILIITRYVALYDYGLPFFSQFVMLEFFLLASMGIASAVAGLVKNASNMGMINSLIVTPTCMLGGCFWPVSLMPDWMQKIADFVPQKWVIEAIQLMAAGQSLSQMWMHMGVLTLFALILLGVGTVILRPEDAEVG